MAVLNVDVTKQGVLWFAVLLEQCIITYYENDKIKDD